MKIYQSLEVLSESPQGASISPLLFIFYINDMPDVVNSLIRLFADGSNLISIVKNIKDRENLQKILIQSSIGQMNG